MWILNKNKDGIFDSSCFIGFYIEERKHNHLHIYAVVGILKDNTPFTLAIYPTLTRAQEEFERLCDAISG